LVYEILELLGCPVDRDNGHDEDVGPIRKKRLFFPPTYLMQFSESIYYGNRLGPSWTLMELLKGTKANSFPQDTQGMVCHGHSDGELGQTSTQ